MKAAGREKVGLVAGRNKASWATCGMDLDVQGRNIKSISLKGINCDVEEEQGAERVRWGEDSRL